MLQSSFSDELTRKPRLMSVSRLKLPLLCLAVCTALCLAFSPPQQLAWVKNPNFVLSGDFAYVLQPPRPISAGGVEKISWSSTGDYLLAVRSEVSGPALPMTLAQAREVGERSIVLYGLHDNKPAVVWRAKGTGVRLLSVDWLASTNSAVVLVKEDLRTEDPSRPRPIRHSVVILDAETGAVTPIYSFVQEGGPLDVGFEPSPTKPYGLLSIEEDLMQRPVALGSSQVPVIPGEPNAVCRLIRANGAIGRPLTLQPNTGFLGWTSDGAAPVLVSGRRTSENFKMDVESGQLTPLPRTTSLWEPSAKSALLTFERERTKTITATGELTVYPLWLISTAANARAMVAGDSSQVALSPSLSGIAYESGGILAVRAILQMPKRAFTEALMAAERERLTHNGKQVALAALMYSADFDDVMAPKGLDLSDLLGPYAKDKGIFDGFVYTYPGGSLSDIKNPATTEMGYIAGPGGRAVVYADGHVKWVPDP
jgi:hypothetical protein